MSIQHLAIVVYRALVDGIPTGSLDVQVRWFVDSDVEQIQRHLRDEPLVRYLNDSEDQVVWELAEVMEILPFEPQEPGDEVIGFIASVGELEELSS